jgi:hypothetical protein
MLSDLATVATGVCDPLGNLATKIQKRSSSVCQRSRWCGCHLGLDLRRRDHQERSRRPRQNSERRVISTHRPALVIVIVDGEPIHGYQYFYVAVSCNQSIPERGLFLTVPYCIIDRPACTRSARSCVSCSTTHRGITSTSVVPGRTERSSAR